MSKRLKILLLLALAFVLAVFFAALAIIIAARTSLLDSYAKRRLTAYVEQATGGAASIDSFQFDFRSLAATVRGVTIRGKEPEGSPPLFYAPSVTLKASLFTRHKIVALEQLVVSHPEMTLVTLPDGELNLPTPASPSRGSVTSEAIQLAIGRFDITDGSLRFADHVLPVSLHGRDLNAHITFTPESEYRGEIAALVDIQDKAPLAVRLRVPLVLRRSEVAFNQARIESPHSSIVITAKLYDLQSPHVSAQLDARLSLSELCAPLGLPARLGKAGAGVVDLHTTFDATRSGVTIQHADLRLGASRLEAATSADVTTFRGSVSLGEISSLLGSSYVFTGVLNLAGDARLTFPSYSIQGAVSAIRLTLPIRGLGPAGFFSSFRFQPGSLSLTDMRFTAAHTSIRGSSLIGGFRTIEADADLQGPTISEAVRMFSGKPIAYAGAISASLHIRGPVKAPAIVARVRMSPSGLGIPVNGQLNATYDTATKMIAVSKSAIYLPHSTFDLSGDPGAESRLRFRSHDLTDLSPLFRFFGRPGSPVPRGGAAALDVRCRGSLSGPQLSGSVRLVDFAIGGRRFDELAAGFAASPAGAAITNAALDSGASRVRFTGSLGLFDWRPEAASAIAADVTVDNGHLNDFLLLSGRGDVQAAGNIDASVHVSGTLSRPEGNVHLALYNAHYLQEQISSARLSASISDRLAELTSLDVTTPAGELKARASFSHSPGDLNSGAVLAEVSASEIDLGKSGILQSIRPGLTGNARVHLEAAGGISRRRGEFSWSVSNVNGDVAASGLRDNQEQLGDLAASIHSHGQDANISLTSSLAGSTTRLRGSVRLSGDFPFAADLSSSHLSLGKIAALAHLNWPIQGDAGVSARLEGTPRDPKARFNLQLAGAEMFGQRIDQLTAAGDYSNTRLVLSSLHVTTPAGQVEASGSFSHPPLSFASGELFFHVTIPEADLARVSYVRTIRPGLSGTVSLTADGSAGLNHFQITPLDLTADGAIRDATLNRQPLGSVEVKARTKNHILSVSFQSKAAAGAIQGIADVELSGNFVTHAELGVTNLRYSAIRPILPGPPLPLEASLDAKARFDGSLKAPAEAAARLEVTKLAGKAAGGVAFQNDRPIVMELAHQTLQITSARIQGPSMDVGISGSVALRKPGSMDIDVNANADLAALRSFFTAATAAGSATAKVAVRGTPASPVLAGRIQVSDGSLQLADWPNGLYKANMVILLAGNDGRIESFTAESGGGKVSATGFFSISRSGLSYNFQAAAYQVRTRYAGASITANADLRLSGTGRSGLLNGAITISRVGYGQQSDIGSILAAATKPPAPPSPPTGVLSSIRANLRIQTAPDALFQTTLAQQLSATANLTLLGSLANPGMVGRITINSGTLMFFANKYAVNHGIISFYDPSAIQPVLDIDLETVAQGVDVNLTVAGPMDNLKLSYRSDPPLKFEDIVALLAAGKTPPDPAIASNQPAAPDQSAMQMGESALVGAAVANPVASRLQRVFGVSQLTIAPTFVSGTALPQARITLQQQVAQNVTFTYSQDVSQANAELVRIEWELAPQFSAVAARDENGVFSVDFFWKKQFR